MVRNTRQRGAIRRAFQSAGRPLSPPEAHRIAQHEARGLGIATVYRNIRALVEEGWLAEVGLPGEANRYELAGKEHHHHFRCSKCSRVFDVPCDSPGGSERVPAGFVVTGHDLLLHGYCADCRG